MINTNCVSNWFIDIGIRNMLIVINLRIIS